MKVWILSLSALLLWRYGCDGCGDAEPSRGLRIVSFNIENYPRSPAQSEAVFAAIADLKADAVAVQEITNPPSFAAEAKRRLGEQWRFVYAVPSPLQRVGVLFNQDELELLSKRVHRQTIVYKGAKPAFEARFRPVRGGEVVRMIVVHLKASGVSEDVRATQLRALEPVIARANNSGERIMVLGDFNATGEVDRANIAGFADRLGMQWASRKLECTAYWRPGGGNCTGSALDHVVSWEKPGSVQVRGACQESGCSPQECPTWYSQVSDHCPVQIDLR